MPRSDNGLTPRSDIGLTPQDLRILPELARILQQDVSAVGIAYIEVERNVRTVLRRQISTRLDQRQQDSLALAENESRSDADERPLCVFGEEEELARSLAAFSQSLEDAIFTLARVYDEAHIILCQGRGAMRSITKAEADFRRKPNIDLAPLRKAFELNPEVADWQLVLVKGKGGKWPYSFDWRELPEMSFDKLSRVTSLSEKLPGERSPSLEYAGIGGGGGSDVISASIFGHLLRRHGKELDLLVSTRAWATGSQGKQGSKMGIKREIYDHDGQVEVDRKIVPGTFRVKGDTSAEGRALEAIPVHKHEQVFIVLDQNGSRDEIAEQDRAELKDQLHAVLGKSRRPLDTIAIVDTGGDVFGANEGAQTTPDQDLRVQQAMCADVNKNKYNLMTVVIAPGVDAPDDAPRKAREAGGMVYTPSKAENEMLLNLLSKEYQMDGTLDGRFGKTTMALQARLKGKTGWTSLDLPEHIVDTWTNPWSSFVYIRECMSDIILIPTEKLLPLIEQPRPEIRKSEL